jgi:CheY-like chemotaxis protein
MKRPSCCTLTPTLGVAFRVTCAAALACGGLGAILAAHTPFLYQLLALPVAAACFDLSGVFLLSNPRRVPSHELYPEIMAAPPASEEPVGAVIGAAGESRTLTGPVTRDWKDLRVLVVDDNSINRRILTFFLAKEGHHVAVAVDGEEALRRFETEEFDVILMDIQMPRMDGFEATARIRRQEIGTGRRIPIVAVSAHAMSGFREECLAAGMDRYVSLPLCKEDLFAAMVDCLKGQGKSADR